MAQKTLIIGLGNMSGAMLAGWLATGVDPSRFAVLNRTPRPVPTGVTSYASTAEAAASGAHDTLLLGFKPQQLSDLAPGFQALAGENVSVHSLLGGFTLGQIATAFPNAKSHLRVMPNLAARINKSPVLLAGKAIDDRDRALAIAHYGQLGRAVWLDDETQYDLMTALAGSGPGFVYRFIDALGSAGAELGLDPKIARSLAVATVEGAANLAAMSDASPAALADDVASPGGMTREGLNVLDENNALRTLLTQTLEATARRGQTLSKGGS